MAVATKSRRVPPAVSDPVAALADLPAGPALCVALAAIDPATVTGYETVLVLRARMRQVNYERGMLLAAVAETTRRTDHEHGVVADHDLRNRRARNISELRTALVLTRSGANVLGGLATDLTQRLPMVLAAMVAGVLDEPRARVFSSWTEQLADRHAQALVEHLLPVAPRLTTGELIEAIQRKAIELDPRWARRRYENSLLLRQVKGVLRPDGTADLLGTNLPADQVAAACDRIDALAHRLKQAGYPSLLRWIRADIYLGKLDGRYAGLTDEQLFTHLMANPVPQPAPDPEPATPDDELTDEELIEYYDHLVEQGLLDPEDDVEPVDVISAEGAPEDEPVDASTGPNDADAAAGEVRGRGMRLQVGLSTIAGLDRRPGELLGFGFVHAELARRISAAAEASWHYNLVASDGTPIQVGPIRRRPTRAWAEGDIPDYRSLEVWLTLSPEELARLTHSPPPGWEPVIAGLAAHVAEHAAGPPNGDPAARLPGTPLRRWINIRDRRCVFPGCRVAPHRTDADHTVEHASGGPTVDSNLGSLCRPDHLLRHEHGWRVRQPEPGRFVWTSPLEHEYERRPPSRSGDALEPMARPTRHCEDRSLVWVNGDIGYEGTETCKHRIPSRPTRPDTAYELPPY